MVKKQKVLVAYSTENEAPENCKPFQNRLNTRNCDPTMTQNGYVYAICDPPEVAVDVNARRNVKTKEVTY